MLVLADDLLLCLTLCLLWLPVCLPALAGVMTLTSWAIGPGLHCWCLCNLGGLAQTLQSPASCSGSEPMP